MSEQECKICRPSCNTSSYSSLGQETKYAKDHGKANYEFALERVRDFLKEGGGFGIKGWDDEQIRAKLLPYLVKKRTNQRSISWELSLK
jgi:hypothetical protein